MNQTVPPQRLPADVLAKVVKALPPEVKEVLFVFPQLFVAGGAVRAILADEPVKDIDVFTSSLDTVQLAVPRYIREFSPWGDWKEHKTPCTRTVTVDNGDVPPVQFIDNVAYASPEECLAQFDFTICQAAVWYGQDGWEGICNPAFLRDVAFRRLVYTSPKRVEAPGGSLWRAFKFAQRGYAIDQTELTKLVVRLNASTMRLCREDAGDPWEYDPEAHGRVIARSYFMPSREGGAAGVGGDGTY